jgi:hypothetical protein
MQTASAYLPGPRKCNVSLNVPDSHGHRLNDLKQGLGRCKSATKIFQICQNVCLCLHFLAAVMHCENFSIFQSLCLNRNLLILIKL